MVKMAHTQYSAKKKKISLANYKSSYCLFVPGFTCEITAN